MKIHDVIQGEAEWVALRLGKVTASEMGNLITPEWKIRTGEMPRTYLCEKLAEAWRKQPLPGFSAWSTEQGELLEAEAWSWYALEYDEEIKRVGFCETDDSKAGCSPDGLLGSEGGIEIKCPGAVNHVKWLLAGELPKDHAVQVHASLYVTGRAWWRFLSYHRGFPKLVVTVKPEPSIMQKIKAALDGFYYAFDEAMTRLKELHAA